MKKILFILLCILPFATSYAQPTGLYYHTRVGIGQSVFKNNNIPDQNGKIALNLGFGGTYQFIKNVGVSAEAMFTNKGTRVRGTEVRTLSTERFEDTYKLYYAEIPLLVKLSFGITEDFYIKAFAGPSFNFNLMGTYSRNYDNPSETDTRDQNINGLNSMEQSLVYGLGVDILTSTEQTLSLDVRMNNALGSFGDIYDQNNNLIKGYNNYFTIGLGFGF